MGAKYIIITAILSSVITFSLAKENLKEDVDNGSINQAIKELNHSNIKIRNAALKNLTDRGIEILPKLERTILKSPPKTQIIIVDVISKIVMNLGEDAPEKIENIFWDSSLMTKKRLLADLEILKSQKKTSEKAISVLKKLVHLILFQKKLKIFL